MADEDGRFTVENDRLEAAAAAAAELAPDPEPEAEAEEPKKAKGGLAGPSKAGS